MARRAVVGCLAGLLLFGACARADGQPQWTLGSTESPIQALRVRLGVTTTPIPALTSSILWLAKDRGIYQGEGLDVEISELTGAPVAITALQAGDVDVATLGVVDTIRLNASQTMSVRAIGASGSDDFPFMVARDSIGSIAELRGKSYAVSRLGAADDATTRRMLTANGVDPSEVNFVVVGAPSVRAQALLAGQIDATTVQISTWVVLRDKPGLKLLASLDEIRAVVPNSATLNVATTHVISTKTEQLRRFTTAVMKAARLFATDKQAWVDSIRARRTDLGRYDLEFLWDQFTTAWGVNGFLNLTRLQREADSAYDSTAEFAPLPRIGTADWIDTRFVDEALNRLGIFPGYDDPGRPRT